VALIDETVVVDIPPGTQPGAVIDVPGKGFPFVGRPERGTLHVFIRVSLPTEVSDKERELLESLDSLS